MKGTTASKVKPDPKSVQRRLLKNSTSESPAKKQKIKSLLEFWGGGGPSSNAPANIETNMQTTTQQRLPSDLDLEKPRPFEVSESSADQDFGD